MEFTGFEAFDDNNDQTMAEDIKRKLYEKYNKEFEVLRIGNRIGGTSIDRIDTYCAPKDNPKVVFTAIQDLTMEGEETEEDDYYLKCVTSNVEELLTKDLAQNGIDAICRIETIKKNSLDESIQTQDFINKYPNAKFLCIMAIQETEKYKVQEAFENINNAFQNIKLNSIIYTVSEDTLTYLKEKLYGTPFFPRALVESKGFNYKTYLKIENGSVSEIIGE